MRYYLFPLVQTCLFSCIGYLLLFGQIQYDLLIMAVFPDGLLIDANTTNSRYCQGLFECTETLCGFNKTSFLIEVPLCHQNVDYHSLNTYSYFDWINLILYSSIFLLFFVLLFYFLQVFINKRRYKDKFQSFFKLAWYLSYFSSKISLILAQLAYVGFRDWYASTKNDPLPHNLVVFLLMIIGVYQVTIIVDVISTSLRMYKVFILEVGDSGAW